MPVLGATHSAQIKHTLTLLLFGLLGSHGCGGRRGEMLANPLGSFASIKGWHRATSTYFAHLIYEQLMLGFQLA